jgi:hypothetical protein
MWPIEVLYITIGLTIAIVGVGRGYVKELGSTLIVLIAIFILTFFEDQLSTLLTGMGERLFGLDTQEEIDLLLSSFYTIVFIVIVFMGYAGHTLAFHGQPAPPPQGTLISLAIGLLNGYLIAGMLWYYQDAYGYPLGQVFAFTDQLTTTAQTMVNYLPPNLFDNPVYWIVPVAVLLIIRVRG